MNEAYAEYEEYDDEYESDLCACPNCGGELKVNEDCGVECTECEEFIGWYIPNAGAVKLLDKWAGRSANWKRQEVSAMSRLADKLFDRLEEIADRVSEVCRTAKEAVANNEYQDEDELGDLEYIIGKTSGIARVLRYRG